MGLPRLGGQGGNGGDVWVVAKKNMTLKRIKDKYPLKRFVGGSGGNSRLVHLLSLTCFGTRQDLCVFCFGQCTSSEGGERDRRGGPCSCWHCSYH